MKKTFISICNHYKIGNPKKVGKVVSLYMEKETPITKRLRTKLSFRHILYAHVTAIPQLMSPFTKSLYTFIYIGPELAFYVAVWLSHFSTSSPTVTSCPTQKQRILREKGERNLSFDRFPLVSSYC